MVSHLEQLFNKRNAVEPLSLHAQWQMSDRQEYDWGIN